MSVSSHLLYGKQASRDRRLILDAYRRKIRCGSRSAKLGEEDVSLLRLAWDHRGEALDMLGVARVLATGHGYGSLMITDVDKAALQRARRSLGQLCAELSRSLGVCPLHQLGSGWVWDGDDCLVELTTCSL